MASAGKDTLVKLWDVRAGAPAVATLHGHKATIMQAHWNANGNWLLTASRDQTCKARPTVFSSLWAAQRSSLSCTVLTHTAALRTALAVRTALHIACSVHAPRRFTLLLKLTFVSLHEMTAHHSGYRMEWDNRTSPMVEHDLYPCQMTP